MNYILFAIGCYIILRGLQILLEDYMKRPWCKKLIKVWAVFMIYAALAGLFVFYNEFSHVYFLGFNPAK